MASPLSNTWNVWHALFLRETLDRFFANRAGWAWLIVEPLFQLIIMCFFYYWTRGAYINGADLVVWLMVGMLGFFVFRRTAIQTLHSADCNRAFFAFRQVRPADAAIARGSVEAFSMFLVGTFSALIAFAIGKDIIPHDPLLVLVAVIGLWLMGLGYGMITCVFMRLVQDLGHIIMILMMPLYFLSGAVFPLTFVPPQYRQYLLYNPIAHAIELIRIGFFTNYHGMDVSLGYVYLWVIGLLSFGLVLFKLMETRLLTK